MSALAATLRLDARVQARNRLYHIGLAVSVLLGLGGRFLFEREALEIVLPAVFLLALGSTTYMFVASLILLEKGDGTLGAVRVTPLRFRDYLGSKLSTLTAFALVESVVVLLIAYGVRGVRPMPLIAGVAGMGVLYTLIGVAQVAPHDSVTDFLMPSAMVGATVLQLPVFHLLDILPSPIWYVIPTQAPALLVAAAFRPIAGWELAYAVVYGGVAIAVAYRVARSRFVRHVAPGWR